MPSYNRVVLIGNVTRDIEVRYIASGTAVADIGLAVNDKRKSPNGEWVEETTFVDITAWGRTAEVAGEYLAKGSPCLIEGRLKLDSWENRDGEKRSKLKVIADRLVLLGSGSGNGGAGNSGRSSQPQAERSTPNDPPQHDTAATAQRSAVDDFPENDIPF